MKNRYSSLIYLQYAQQGTKTVEKASKMANFK